MLARSIVVTALTAALLAVAPAVAEAPATLPQPAPFPLPDALVLRGDHVITVQLNGIPVRLEVSAEAFGTPVINPAVAERLQLLPDGRRRWLFGPVAIEGVSAVAAVDFGAGPVPLMVSWADRPASNIADGVIGVHHLPYQQVTFVLAERDADQTEQRFVLTRTGGTRNTRLGTAVTVGKRQLMMIFVPERAENLITAPTANFIATHQEGGFVPGSQGRAVMDFGVERPVRMMRIAYPIALGNLAVDRFAVRIEDYGEPKRVGEIGPDDPRFDPNQILVSRRKGRGKPDLLTRIGRNQIAHCSALIYDLAASEIRLRCDAQAD